MEKKTYLSGSGSLVEFEQTILLAEWLKDLLQSIEKCSPEQLCEAVSTLRRYNEEAIRSKNDSDCKIYSGLLEFLDIAAKEKASKGGKAPKASKGIAAAVSQIKRDTPSITGKDCWEELIRLASNNHEVSISGTYYELSLESEDQTDLSKAKVISVYDITGKKDGRGITKGTFTNKFKSF